jgi:hypothetical protein
MTHPLYPKVKDLFKTNLSAESLNQIKNMFLPDNHYSANLKSLDSHLPSIAYVRFFSDSSKTERSRGFKPFELYDLIFIRKFYHVKMFQSFIYSSGDELMNPNHSTILAEYKLNIKKDPGAISEPQFNFYREQTDHRKKQNKEYVRYFNPEISD